MEKYYTFKFMYKTMPDWKRKKDPILTRWFYRPLSFYFSARCANLGISANQVSFVSAFVAILSCVSFLFGNYYLNILGALGVNLWLLMDCVDGNIARSVKKEAFGPFADSMSSYILVGLLCSSIGFSAYFDGGILFDQGNVWIILIGVLASASDSLMRLIYQKYKNVEKELQEAGVLKAEIDERQDIRQSSNWKIKIDENFGIGGILPLLVLLGAIFHALDLVAIYCLCFFGPVAIVSICLYVRKAICAAKKFPLG